MVFVTAFVATAAFLGVSTFSLAMTTLSVGYQLHQNNKMKKAQEAAAAERAAAAEARKGFEATQKDTVVNLPVVYGKNKLGGVITDYKTASNYTFSNPNNFNPADYSGFLLDNNNFIQVIVEGAVSLPLTEEGQTGNDITNISKITTSVVFNGVTVESIVKTNVGTNFRIGDYLSLSFEDYRSKISAVEKDNFIYYAGEEFRISDYVYRFKVQRVARSNLLQVFSQGLDGNQSGSKNEFLFAQAAISFSGISRVLDVNIDGQSVYYKDYATGIRVNCYPNGGVDNLSVSNGFKSTNLFTKAAYVACAFKLNRDEPQYSSGIPQLEFFVEGQEIYDITPSYGISSTKSYSNNPARVLLDYLTNADYGRGLSFDKIDLESFYNAKVTCDEIVKVDATKQGKVNLGVGVQSVKRYEINSIIDTSNPIRTNVTQILESMSQATLIWSGGKYKLNLAYPIDQPSVENGLIDARHVFTDDDIMKSEISIAWPSAESKLNQATVSFANSFEDFKDDSVSWPTFSLDPLSPYQQYLVDDNGETLRTTIQPIGITNPYHALAKAEEAVRLSRFTHTINVNLSRKAILLEPGDFFLLSSEAVDIEATVYRAESIKINADLSITVEAYSFDYETLSWNIDDDEAYSTSVKSTEVVNPITNFLYNFSNTVASDLGRLSWEYEDDPGNGNYTYKVFYKESSNSNYILLGSTLNKTITFQKLLGVDNNDTYDFKVTAITPLGETVSEVFLLDQSISQIPNGIVSFSVNEELYVTSTAAGVKSRAILSWVTDNSGVATAYVLVEYKSINDVNYITLGTFPENFTTVFDLKPNSYEFKLTPYGFYKVPGSSLISQKLIAGLSQVPNDPVNFTGNVNEGQINLSWTLPTDLDVLYGGRVEIRHHISTGGGASWDTASVIVDSLSGNTNNKTVPTIKGTFFIKFIDSTGNYSTNADAFISTFEDKSFNQVETVDEKVNGFSGVKTNCFVNGDGNLELTTGQTEMSYEFSNYVDLGEVVTVRTTPSIIATVVNRGVLVSSYVLISSIENFAGPVKDASLLVKVSTTQDDPSGTPTWSPYELLTVSSFTCRALRFEFVGIPKDNNTDIIISELSILLDKKDIIKRGTSVSSATADTIVTFDTPFYGGLGGTNSPTIGLLVIGGSVGDAIVITERNKTGYTYSIYGGSPSVRQVRTIDWQAIGQ